MESELLNPPEGSMDPQRLKSEESPYASSPSACSGQDGKKTMADLEESVLKEMQKFIGAF